MEIDNINVLESIKTNYLSWTFIFISIIAISYPHIKGGFLTFIIFLLFAYFVHRGSHDYRNVFTILHHYHHENNNFFSHLSQILLELSLGMLLLPIYYYLGNDYIDIWTGIFFILFYSTIHNYNYGQLRVNDVHYIHHQNIYTNIGPDICDIAFGTKSKINKEVENTNHYIPNVVVISILVLILKYLCKNNTIKNLLLNILFILMSISTIIILFSSIYLYFTYDNNKKLENVENELARY